MFLIMVECKQVSVLLFSFCGSGSSHDPGCLSCVSTFQLPGEEGVGGEGHLKVRIQASVASLCPCALGQSVVTCHIALQERLEDVSVSWVAMCPLEKR